MKKLIISAAIVCAAVVAQAASFKWTTSSAKLYGVTAASVIDNGSYGAASSGTTDRGDKVLNSSGTSAGSLAYILSIYDVSTDALVGSASGAVTYGSLGKVGIADMNVTEAAQGTTYKYVLELTGTQKDLVDRGVDGDYDYSAATVSATFNGTVTTAASGVTSLFASDTVPTTWTVSGITKAGGGSDVPEPTSGLLLVLGGAMLALRRRRA